jgi:hypothetical protein
MFCKNRMVIVQEENHLMLDVRQDFLKSVHMFFTDVVFEPGVELTVKVVMAPGTYMVVV